MIYDVTKVAAELMLNSEDLQEIYEMFFNEVADIFDNCQTALQNNDAKILEGLLHALKGSSVNLRAKRMGELAGQLEQEAKAGNIQPIAEQLPYLKQEFQVLQQQILSYYKK